jgi:hypothetical protein
MLACFLLFNIMLWNLSALPCFTIVFIKLCFKFYVCFCIPLTLMWSIVFLCLTSCSNYAILLQAGLLEVPVSYMGSLGYFLA